MLYPGILAEHDEPNEALVEAAQQYEAEKKNEIDSTPTNVAENQKQLLIIMKNYLKI